MVTLLKELWRVHLREKIVWVLWREEGILITERGVRKREWKHIGDWSRKTYQNHWLGKRVGVTTYCKFVTQQSSKCEVLQVYKFVKFYKSTNFTTLQTRVVPGRLSSVPVGKEGWGLGAGNVVSGSSGPHREEEFPFLEFMWECWHGLSGDKRAGRSPCSALLTTRGTETPADSSKSWCHHFCCNIL